MRKLTTIAELAEECCISGMTIRNYIKKYDIKGEYISIPLNNRVTLAFNEIEVVQIKLLLKDVIKKAKEQKDGIGVMKEGEYSFLGIGGNPLMYEVYITENGMPKLLGVTNKEYLIKNKIMTEK